MENNKNVLLPIVGRIQHGEQQSSGNNIRIVDLRLFYCKSQRQ